MAPVHFAHACAREHTILSAPSLSTSSPAGFDRFGLHDAVRRGIRAAGFETPRAIQSEIIPAALDGRDVLGLAQTGTGKTAAFALPLLQRLQSPGRPGPRALILAPTRELARQIDAEIAALARFTRIRTATIFGGVSMRAQIAALARQPEIVVGCPGRILDLIGQRALRLASIEALVLDEADHMFDMGFLPDLRRILAVLPAQRQNLLFSATMPSAIRALADAVLRDPHVVELATRAPAATIDHALYAVAEEHKRDLLEQILAGADCASAIVFTRTKHRARRLAEQLGKRGHRTVALQGNMSQSQRDRAMSGFRARRFDVLVATDHRRARSRRERRVARDQLRRPDHARGLHAPDRPHGPRGAHGDRAHVRHARRSRVAARHRAHDRRADPAPPGPGHRERTPRHSSGSPDDARARSPRGKGAERTHPSVAPSGAPPARVMRRWRAALPARTPGGRPGGVPRSRRTVERLLFAELALD